MRADPTQVQQWLETLHGSTPGMLHICSSGDWTGRRFPGSPPGRAAATRYVMDLDGTGVQGIYLRSTTLTADAPSDHGRRAGAEFSAALAGLAADIDIAGPGHKHQPNWDGMSDYDPARARRFPLPADEDAARAIVEEAGLLEPTLWVHSGGGVYPWWLLDKPEALEGDDFALGVTMKLSDGWQRVLVAAGHRLGLEYGNVGDLPRVMRIPGTVNRKDGLERPCRIIENGGNRYSFDDLGECLLSVQQSAPPDPPHLPPVAVAAPASRQPVTGPREGSPLDAFETATSWDAILSPVGWTVHHVVAGTTYWTRPGKNRGEGHSATTGRSGDRDRMWVFSTACGLPVDQPMTKAYVWGVLNGHGGDMKTVAKALVSTGFGQRLAPAPGFTTPLRPAAGPPVAAPAPAGTPPSPAPPPPIPAPVTTLTPQGRGVAAPAAPISPVAPAATTLESTEAGWHPAPVRPGEGHPLPAFPVDQLPPAMRDLVTQVAASKQVDPIMPALFALSTVSAVAAGKLQVLRSGDWSEPLSFYTCPVADSGERKSPTGRSVFGAVRRIEKQMAAKHNDEVDALVDELDAQRAAAGSNPAAANRVEDKLAAAQASRKRPPRIQLANDITPEALVRSLASLGGHGAILDAEGTFMGILSGRYSKGQPNPELIIKAYDGDAYTADRISRDPDHIERPTLAMALAVQRVVLEDAMSSKILIERGALARIVYGFPASLVGSRWEANAAPFEAGPGRGWALVIEGIAELPAPESADQVPAICLSPEALQAHIALADQIEYRLGPGGDLTGAGIKEWGHKHAGRVLRIAALLHLAAGFTNTTEIQLQAMQAAIAIGEWAIEHARHAHRVDRESAEEATTKQCTKLLEWIASSGVRHLTVREACRGIRAQWVTTKSMTDALDQLAELGWVREEAYQDRACRWRQRFAVSPHIARAMM